MVQWCSCDKSGKHANTSAALYTAIFSGLLHQGVYNFKGVGRGPGLSIWKHDFDLWVEGDDLDMYQQHEGGFESMHAILPMWGIRAKNGSKTEN